MTGSPKRAASPKRSTSQSPSRSASPSRAAVKKPEASLDAAAERADAGDSVADAAAAANATTTEAVTASDWTEEDDSKPTVSTLYEDFGADEINVTLAPGAQGPVPIVHKFEELNLSEPLLKGVYSAGFNAPSIIQRKALPLLLRNPPANMIAQSRSGTGKTAAFVLTMLARTDPQVRAPQAVCLANTRELAVQIVAVVQQLAKHSTGHTVCMAVRDSVPRGARVQDPIVVGTPGTILDLVRRRQLDLGATRVLVLDEADAMLYEQNMFGQCRDVRKFTVKANPQVLLFSATFPDKVKEFAAAFAPNANILMLPRDEVNVKAIHQFFVKVKSPEAKYDKLVELYGLLTVGQSIIFVQRKDTAYSLEKRLTSEGHAVTVLTGDDPPEVRDQTMANFRSGKSKVLIATNVLARGIDVPQINLVVNYDLPVDAQGRPDHEAYMHRIGRTGRFGREGVSVNFVDSRQAEDVQATVIKHYSLEVREMPDDFDEMEKMLKKCRIG